MYVCIKKEIAVFTSNNRKEKVLTKTNRTSFCSSRSGIDRSGCCRSNNISNSCRRSSSSNCCCRNSM